jgi:branched-subunit amino acid ABC-type transport system permease component
MSSYILFLLLGLGAGSVYALLALGLVLKYRSGGVVDFGHGAVAMFIAYVYLGLRGAGALEFPWPVLPHKLTLTGSAMAGPPAIAISLVYAIVLGLVLYGLIYRPLRHAAPLIRITASIGTMLYLQAIAVLNFGTTPASTPPILPDSPIKIAGIDVPQDRLWLAAITIVLAGGLAVVYRSTRFGLATRAAAENETGASLMGLSADRIGAGNWVIATVLAGVAGILIAPISTVDPTSYTLFIVPALGVALLARFQSFAVAAAGGLVLGMLQSEIVKVLSVASWLPQQGLPEALPFILIVVAMTVFTRGVGARGERAEQHNPSLGLPRRPYVSTVACFVVGLLALVLLQGALRFALISSFVTICLALSLVVLTGYVGQVSLAQLSFAGVSAFTLTHITASLGIGFPFSLLLASFAAVPLGLLIGLPALRLRGVNLAVVTLAAAFAIDALVFNSAGFSGGLEGRHVASPTLFGWNLGIAEGHAYPRVIFGVLVLVIVCLVGLLVARVRRSPAGRMMIAVRSNERAAAAAGIDVARSKLFAFALSAWIAGLGGCLYAYTSTNVSGPTFATFNSVGLLAIVYIGSVGRISGAVVAGVMLSATGLLVTFLNIHLNIGQYQPVVAGVLLTLTAIKQPDGIAANPPPPLVALGRRLAGLWGGTSTPSPPDASDSSDGSAGSSGEPAVSVQARQA